MNKVQEFLQNARIWREWECDRKIALIREPLVCKDGFVISIQASCLHYCSPQDNLPDCNYDSVEVGYISREEPILLPWAENKDETFLTSYLNVPIKVVEQVIKAHGGIDAIKSYNKQKDR